MLKYLVGSEKATTFALAFGGQPRCSGGAARERKKKVLEKFAGMKQCP